MKNFFAEKGKKKETSKGNVNFWEIQVSGKCVLQISEEEKLAGITEESQRIPIYSIA